jgi:hypothetical protein
MAALSVFRNLSTCLWLRDATGLANTLHRVNLS